MAAFAAFFNIVKNGVLMNKIRLLTYNPHTGEFQKVMTNGDVRKHIGAPVTGGHLQTYHKKKMVLLHRIAWEMMTGFEPRQIDHIDGDPTNNKWSNLRLANNCQNAHNRKRPTTNTSGVKNVRFCEIRGCYRAEITAFGVLKTKNTKTFEDAIQWVRKTREQLHGEFCNHGDES